MSVSVQYCSAAMNNNPLAPSRVNPCELSEMEVGQIVDVEVAVRNRIHYEACEEYYYYYYNGFGEERCGSSETTYVGAYEQGNGNRTFMVAGLTLQLVFACQTGACATIWDYFEFVEWIPDAAKGEGTFFTAGKSPDFQNLNKCDEAKVNATRGCGFITIGTDVRTCSRPSTLCPSGLPLPLPKPVSPAHGCARAGCHGGKRAGYPWPRPAEGDQAVAGWHGGMGGGDRSDR